MIPYDSIMVPLAAVLGLSITVERILEFIKNVLGHLLRQQSGRKSPNDSELERKIEELKAIHERDRVANQAEEAAEKEKSTRMAMAEALHSGSAGKQKEKLRSELETVEADGEWDEKVSGPTVLVEPAKDPDDGTVLKAFILQVLGFGIGIVLVRLSGVQLFNSFLQPFHHQIQPWLDYLFTGLLIGGGSGPMHVLVKFVTERKVVVPEKPSLEEPAPAKPEPTPSPVIPPPKPTEESLGLTFIYNGGVDRERLEHVHKRSANPSLIVFHHTAMNSSSTFEDVVRTIKNRTDRHGNHWLTGYHCVIMPDGAVRPFCRWDRTGNHAVGYNRISLGLAFHGNFESDPRVPFSNPDGRLGPLRPGEAQLKAGAKVVTLWSFLYSIEIDFEKAIIPHRKISSKSCPGSGFPVEEFRRWVEWYREAWEKSELVQQQIEEFRLKPYLFV